MLDFSKKKEVICRNSDFSGSKEIKGPKEKISLYGASNLPTILNFSKTKEVDLDDVDFFGVKEIKGPIEKISLFSARNLPAVLDFSKTKEVDLCYADLSGVKEIKWPMKVCRLLKEDIKKIPPHIQQSYKAWHASQLKQKKVNIITNIATTMKNKGRSR